MKNKYESDDKKTLILNSTFDEIADKGIRGTSIRSIANRANISKSNIHYYFNTKDDLLQTLQHQLLSGFKTRRHAAMDNAEDTLDEHVTIFFEQKKHMIKNTPEQDLVNKEFWLQAHVDGNARNRTRVNYRNWREDFKSVLNQYTELPENDMEMISLMMVSMLEGIALQYFVEETIDIEGYLSYCKEYLLTLIVSKNKRLK